MEKTTAAVLAGNHLHNPPPCSMLEGYYETTIFIPMDITEDVENSVARKLSGSSGSRGTNSEALQRRLLKFRAYSEKFVPDLKFSYIGWPISPVAADCTVNLCMTT